MVQHGAVFCSVMQCVAVCCSVVQCSAVCCSVVQCSAVWCSVVHCIGASVRQIRTGVVVCFQVICLQSQGLYVSINCTFCSGLTHCNILRRTLQYIAQCNTLKHTATCCNTLQHTATHCTALHHTTTYCITLHTLQHHVVYLVVH